MRMQGAVWSLLWKVMALLSGFFADTKQPEKTLKKLQDSC